MRASQMIQAVVCGQSVDDVLDECDAGFRFSESRSVPNYMAVGHSGNAVLWAYDTKNKLHIADHGKWKDHFDWASTLDIYVQVGGRIDHAMKTVTMNVSHLAGNDRRVRALVKTLYNRLYKKYPYKYFVYHSMFQGSVDQFLYSESLGENQTYFDIAHDRTVGGNKLWAITKSGKFLKAPTYKGGHVEWEDRRGEKANRADPFAVVGRIDNSAKKISVGVSHLGQDQYKPRVIRYWVEKAADILYRKYPDYDLLLSAPGVYGLMPVDQYLYTESAVK